MTPRLTPYVLAAGARPGDAEAVVEADTGRRVSRRELGDAVRRTADGLLGLGLRQGDTVGLRLSNGIDFVVALHAVLTAGGSVVPVNPAHTADEARRQLEQAGAGWLIDATDGEGRRAAPLERLTAPPAVAPENAGTGAGPHAREASDSLREAGTAVVASSSGTTGLPKTVRLSHRNMIAALTAGTAALPLAPDDRVLAVLPFAHAYGLQAVLHHTLRCGGTVVTLARYRPGPALRAAAEHGVTRLFAVPPQLRTLCAAQREAPVNLDRLRGVVTGGAPAAPGLLADARRVLGAPVRMGYGLTETAGYLAVAADDDTPEPGRTAPLVAGVEHRLVQGELWVRGPQVARDAVDADGWLRTGDLVSLERGTLRITGRCKELIKVNGYQVAPAELEELMQRHPAVADAAVAAVPDPVTGEAPVAYVVLCAPVADAELAAFVNARVAPYKRVRTVHRVTAIPRTASGKIVRRLLTVPAEPR
ncbi:AMP-binding protein [Streptomyces sp. MUM 203J]|uniref:AMP-binding protein n=1 Tax=Streptomyces sp. MUM 203J TaxID=2791990 RepID=UPI001F04973B|nr:AMP-binding protein [Streptomyces sp. MUM 203J]MCH0538672.1 AMP-binding protein [Streptomyces sp. MUM 203J]